MPTPIPSPRPPALRLSRLVLCGFKSFADRAEFTFDDPITGIVGPNGCGKSNVVDAIKWVLGERSSKSLRGKEMTDVIFAGSAGRKPAGLASVTLSFENPVVERGAEARSRTVTGELEADEARIQEPSATGAGGVPEPGMTGAGAMPESCSQEDEDSSEVLFDRGLSRRTLPIDADIVDVERRLYRDGTSQYLINGRRARLKDIRDLFLDTGIGADAYSIIEQGKVDAMLTASPLERRAIFDEAAGIARYKARRLEAQRKLERAVTNLALTREQLESTERRLKVVKGQAARARRFQELDRELRALRAAVAFDQYDEIRQTLDGLTSSQTRLDDSRRESQGRVGELEQARQDAELARHDLQESQRRLDEELAAARHGEHSAAQRREMTERASAESRAQMARDEARLADQDARAARDEAAEGSLAQEIAILAERLAELERGLEEAGAARAAVAGELLERQAALGERRSAAASIDLELTALIASIAADEKRGAALHEEIARLDDRVAALAQENGHHIAAIAEARSHAEARRACVEALELDLAAAEAQETSLATDRRELSERRVALEQQHHRLDSRRQTLVEMVEARVGLGEAARAVLARRDRPAGEDPSFRGVVAALTDLIEVDPEHAAAVEAALGPALQALVVESVGAMPTPAELASLTGRVMFIAMRAPGSPPAPDGADPLGEHRPAMLAGGRMVSLAGVVRPRPGADPDTPALIERLLGSTCLVESLDAAMLACAVGPGARFVTRDGAVLEPDGRVTAGPVSEAAGEASGMLQRRGELARLERELAGLGAHLDEARAVLERADSRAGELALRRAELRAAVAREGKHLLGEESRQRQAESDAARSARDLEEVRAQRHQAAERLARTESERASLGQRVESLRRLHQDQAGAAARLADEIAAIQARAEAAAERATVSKVECGRLGEQLAAARREHRRLQNALDESQRERRDVRIALDRSRSRLAEHQAVIEQCAAQRAEAAERAAALGAEALALADRLKESGCRVQDLAEKLAAARRHAHHVERDWNSLEISRREAEVKRESLEQRTSEELSIDLAWEYPEYRQVMEPGDVARVEPGPAVTEIEELRRQIAGLGHVNLDAIEEEGQLARRNEELAFQVADIDAAARALEGLISQLNTASIDRFEEAFERIKDRFAGPDGMFRRLFGGGKAEVRLMGLIKEVNGEKVLTEEIDPLESGIEIIAKPPGKEPRSISQLSGGEKTLTAVALLLSIFQSKPSCFCVLDEVDAALDDANVGRYNGVLRDFTAFSHFIVITHNKKTMQAADRLYGVTMQERGVSTRVSVKFEQAERMVEARPGTPAGPASVGERAGAPDSRQAPVVQTVPAVAQPAEAAGELIEVYPSRPRRSKAERDSNSDGRANGHSNGTTPHGILRRALAKMRDEAETPSPPIEN